jgi:uncharacterized membrane protein HdeD (DUF308 family)
MTEANEIKWLSWAVLFAGLLTFALGVFLVIDPEETLKVVTTILGIFLLIDGAIALVAAIFGRVESRAMLGVVGVVAAIAGLILIKKPSETIELFVLVLGVWLVVAGIARFLIAFGVGKAERSGSFGLAAFDLIAGIVILAWPGPSVKTLCIIVGIVFIVRGLIYLWAGWQLHKIAKDADSPGGLAATA